MSLQVHVPSKRLWHPTQGRGQVLSPEGDVLWEDPDWMDNVLADEGEQSMLSVYLKETAHPGKYLGLINGLSTAPTETSTMAYLGGAAGAREIRVPAADGYARQQIVAGDWTDSGLQGGDYRFDAAEKTFGAASGTNWADITHACLVTAATGQVAGSGKFLLYIALSGTTAVNVGQTFKYSLRWTQQ